MVTAYENVALCHPNVISLSLISWKPYHHTDTTILIDYVLNRLETSPSKNLTVFPENMIRNMRLNFDSYIFSQRAMLTLIESMTVSKPMTPGTAKRNSLLLG